MGYRVDYSPVRKVRNAEKRTLRLPALTMLFFLLFVFLVLSFWPRGSVLLREILIPGDPDITVQALEAFARNLRSGEELSGALEVFCRTIVKEAQGVPG